MWVFIFWFGACFNGVLAESVWNICCIWICLSCLGTFYSSIRVKQARREMKTGC